MYEKLCEYIAGKFPENFGKKSKVSKGANRTEDASDADSWYFDFKKLLIAVCDNNPQQADYLMTRLYIETNIAISYKMQQWEAIERKNKELNK